MWKKTRRQTWKQHSMAMASDRFRLTEGTPLRTEPMLSELGTLAVNTPAVEAILNGTYVIPEDTDDFTREFLLTLMDSSPVLPSNRLSCEITKEDFQLGWKKPKERTSSSISGLHYGHYMAAAKDDMLSEIHAIKTELAVTGGCPLPRWQAGLSCMLEKEPGVIKVDKLRAILLMEADFNFFNGLMFAGRMMRRAEARQGIPKEIYGGRKNHEAIEVALNRKLIADILRQKRIPGAVASVDAHTCYDRIAHSAGSLSCQIWDMDPQAIIAMLLTIQRMRFYLRTAFGDSDAFFSSLNDLLPYMGACQGNKGAPAFWLVVSITLVLMLHRLGHVAQLRAAMSLAVFVFAGFLFVDDTDLITVAIDKTETPAQVIARMQDAVNTWHGGLHTTGGALKPIKCSWGLVAFYWDNGQWRYVTKATLPGDLTIPSVTGGAPTTITRHDPSDAIKVVGVIQALDGSMDAQIADLKSRADTWGTQISEGWVPRNLARQALSTMIWPSLKYPLPACTLTESEGDLIVRQLYRRILPSIGACRILPARLSLRPSFPPGLGFSPPIYGAGNRPFMHRPYPWRH